MDTLLYRCADCGALYQTEGRGNELRCRACGSRHLLDENYHFTDAPYTIGGYFDAIRQMEAQELGGLSLHAAVRTKIFGANGGPVRWENGECTLDTKVFHYRSAAQDFTIPVEKLPGLAFSCGKEFELYHEDELYYFYPKEERKQVTRWALIVDLMAQARNAGEHREGKRADGEA